MAVIFYDPAIAITDFQANYDGMDPAEQYQMLPVGGTRPVGLFIGPDETEDVLVFPADPNHAYIWGMYALQGQPVQRGAGYLLKPNSLVRFFITGRDAGPTRLDVETERGKLRGFLLVSVKRELPKTYQLGTISDPIHRPNTATMASNMLSNMIGVKKLWSDQANITLSQVGEINHIEVPINLGDIIDTDNQDNLNAIMAASMGKFVKADVYLFAAWAIKGAGFPGLNGIALPSTICLIANWSLGASGVQTMSHETGHILGLPDIDGPQSSLMWRQYNISSTFLSEREIETVNWL